MREYQITATIHIVLKKVEDIAKILLEHFMKKTCKRQIKQNLELNVWWKCES